MKVYNLSFISFFLLIEWRFNWKSQNILHFLHLLHTFLILLTLPKSYKKLYAWEPNGMLYVLRIQCSWMFASVSRIPAWGKFRKGSKQTVHVRIDGNKGLALLHIAWRTAVEFLPCSL